MKFYDFKSLDCYIFPFLLLLFLFAINNFSNNSYVFHKYILTVDFYAGHRLCYNL